MNKVISLLDKKDYLILVDYEKIDSISYYDTSKLVISVNGHGIELSNYASMATLKCRLDVLKELDKIGIDNLDDEMKKIHLILTHPEQYKEEDMFDYVNVFFESNELRTYQVRTHHLSLTPDGERTLSILTEKIDAFKEKTVLNNSLNHADNAYENTNKHKLKI
jgi:hypothetical protein